MARVPTDVIGYNNFIKPKPTFSVTALNADAKSWLYDLVTGRAPNAATERMNHDDPFGGSILGGVQVLKYGLTATLPPGSATGPNAGKSRFVRRTEKGMHHWFLAEHYGLANDFNFKLLVFPRCRTCAGTKEELCPACAGFGTVTQTDDLSRFITRAKCTCCTKGVRTCPTCSAAGGPYVANGVAVRVQLADWTAT